MTSTLLNKLVTDCVTLTIIAIYGILHCIRLHFRGGERNTKSNAAVCKIGLKAASFLILIVYAVSRLISLFFYIPGTISNYHVTDKTCSFFIKFMVIAGITGKFGNHLFVLLRSRLADFDRKRIYYKIGTYILSLFSL